MKRGFIGTAILVFGTALVFAAALQANADAQSNQGPSVLVQLTSLQKGSLPRVITVFGKVETSAAARQTIMAPVTAVVETIFVKPGERVAGGTPLVRLGPSPGTAAAYKKARSALNAARELVQRTESLLGQHLATRQQLADAKKSASDAQVSLAALVAEGGGSPQVLSAPFDTIVIGVSTSPGALVSQGAALLDLARPNGLVLRAGVVPEQAAEVHKGDPVNIKFLGEGNAGSGTVLLRGSIVDSRTGLVPIDIALPTGRFLPGQMAQAGIITGKVQGYVVPHEAILVNGSGAPYVVQVANMIAHQVPVRILLSAGDKDVVAGALDPSASLVLTGNYQLRNGMKVRVANPNRSGKK
jgi:membrane fusion protein, multidrug efflux system